MEKRKELTQCLDGLEALPLLPGSARQLRSWILEEEPPWEKMALLVGSDAALCAKLVSLGRLEKPQPLREVLKGIELWRLRKAFFDLKVWPEEKMQELPIAPLLKHSLACGLACHFLAEGLMPQRAHEALLAGLLHDMGKLILCHCLPEDYVQVLKETQSQGYSLIEAERKLLGLDHTLVGKWAAEQWQWPDFLTNLIWLHHHPQDFLKHSSMKDELLVLLQLANNLCKVEKWGLSGDEKFSSVDGLLRVLGLKHQEGLLKEVTDRVRETLGERCALLGIEPSQEISQYYQSLEEVQTSLSHSLNILEEQRAVLEEKGKALEALRELISALQRAPSLSKALFCLANALQSLGFAEGLCTLFHNEDLLQGSAWSDEAVVDFLHPVNEQGQIFSGRITSMLHLARKKAQNPSSEREKVEGMVIYPLVIGSKRIGLIMVEDRPHNQEVLTSLASLAGLALHRLLQEARQKERSEELASSLLIEEQTLQRSLRAQKLASLAHLASGAAHEINNPLTVISGRAQILLGKEEDSEKRKALETIVEQASRISQILKDLRAIAQPPPPRKEPTDINQLIEKLLATHEAKLARKSILCTKSLEPSLPTIAVDRSQLEEALSNLILNAEEAMPHGGHLTLSTALANEGSQVVIKVKDTGVGISEEDMDKIFSPFFTTKEEGWGLGLSLAKTHSIITSHRGGIKVESQKDRGTTFSIYLATEGPAEENKEQR